MSMSLEGVSFWEIGFMFYMAPETNGYTLGNAACQRGIPFPVSIPDSLNHGCATPAWGGRIDSFFRLSIYVLESSNSRRLTYFMPPLVS